MCDLLIITDEPQLVSVSNLSVKIFIGSEYSRISILEGASFFFIPSESTRHKDVLQSDKITKLNEKK